MIPFVDLAQVQPYPPPPPYQQPYQPSQYQPYPQPQQPSNCPQATLESDDDWELDERGCKKKKEKKLWELGGIFGVRVAVLNTNGAEKNGTYVGVMAAVSSEQFQVGKVYSGHYSSFGYLGGGSAGFEGGLGGTMLLGARAPFGDTHGPLARVGMSAEMQGNKQFYYSRLALPVAEVGYQYASNRASPDRILFELGGRGGAMITGRYNTGDRTRRELGDGSLEWGFYAAAHTALTRLDISYTRIQADDNYPGGSLGTLRGTSCTYWRRIGFCFDGMFVKGEGYIGLPRVPLDVSTTYAGVTVGVVDL